MPRDGSTGNYTKPYLNVIAGDVIESAEYNGTINDISDDLNVARPVVAGGTGGTSPVTARKGIGAEAAGVLVTNYDTHVFEPGSFYSTPTATGEPVASHNFAGVCYGVVDAATPGNTKLVLEARDLNDVNNPPGGLWVRTKVGTAAWSTWLQDGGRTQGGSGDDAANGFIAEDMFFGVVGTAPNSTFVVNTEGDRSGTDQIAIPKDGSAIAIHAPLTVIDDAPIINLNRIEPAQTMSIRGNASPGGQRWQMDLGNSALETGGNAGTNFILNRFADNGAFIDIPFQINRATGNATFSGNGTFGGTISIQGEILSNVGYRTRAGRSGAHGAYPFNIEYLGGSSARLWIDDNPLGVIPLVSGDEADIIQSLKLAVANLTDALQKATARIEALEAKPS